MSAKESITNAKANDLKLSDLLVYAKDTEKRMDIVRRPCVSPLYEPHITVPHSKACQGNNTNISNPSHDGYPLIQLQKYKSSQKKIVSYYSSRISNTMVSDQLT